VFCNRETAFLLTGGMYADKARCAGAFLCAGHYLIIFVLFFKLPAKKDKKNIVAIVENFESGR